MVSLNLAEAILGSMLYISCKVMVEIGRSNVLHIERSSCNGMGFPDLYVIVGKV